MQGYKSLVVAKSTRILWKNSTALLELKFKCNFCLFFYLPSFGCIFVSDNPSHLEMVKRLTPHAGFPSKKIFTLIAIAIRW